MNAQAVTREIRRAVWPALRAEGFDAFSGRTAWRHVGDAVDVVNFQSFGASIADAVGCTSFSFSVNLGVWSPEDPAPALKPDVKGRPRPQEWQCGQRTRLRKSIPQPWFRPFTSADTRRWPLGPLRHREGLKRVVRRDTHDREDIWYVLPDGGNLAETVEDALRAIRDQALRWFASQRRREPA